MSLQALIIVGIVIVVAILVFTLISVNRAYAFKHTIDEKPQNNYQNNSNMEG